MNTATPSLDYPRLVVPGLTQAQCAILARSRTFPLYRKARADMLSGKCPFCELDPTFNVVIVSNEKWQAWQSRGPEKGTKHHFIIAPLRHVKAIAELSYGEWASLADILSELDRKYDITSSGIQIRDGDARLSAGTVEHLHVHKMVPDGTARVESPFFKGVASEAEGNARAIVFEKLHNQVYGQGMNASLAISALAEEEFALIENRMD